MTEPRGRWTALRITMQFADLLQRGVPGPGPVSYLTTGVHRSFDTMGRNPGRSRISSFLLCYLFSDALGLPQGACLISFFRGNGQRLLVSAVRCSPHSVYDHRKACSC